MEYLSFRVEISVYTSCISYTIHATNKMQIYKTSLKCAYLNLPYGNTIFKKNIH